MKQRVRRALLRIGSWKLPTTRRSNIRLRLLGNIGRSPCVEGIGIDWRVRCKDRIDDPPGFFDVILAREESGVASHGIRENTFVGFRLFGTWMTAGFELDRQ